MIAKARDTVGGNSLIAWEVLRDEASGCTRCPLYKPATQTVFGEGPIDAPLMFVGEQPGDQEDLAGRPFVGPAGQMFDKAMAEAGVDRSRAYVTNAVKHFKFEQRGKRRIHAKPGAGEIDACRWWIEQEQMLISPPKGRAYLDDRKLADRGSGILAQRLGLDERGVSFARRFPGT